MRAALVACLLVTATVARADEAKSASTWIAELIQAPARAVARTAPSFRHDAIVRGSDCMPKFKRAGVVKDEAKLRYLTCLGTWLALANIEEEWSVRTLDKLPGDNLKSFARALGKDAKLVLGAHSDGFILIGLGPTPKDGGEPAVLGILIDNSAAE